VVTAEVTVGVPETAPVEVEKLNPVGNVAVAPLAAFHNEYASGAVPPPPVTGVYVVIKVLSVSDWVATDCVAVTAEFTVTATTFVPDMFPERAHVTVSEYDPTAVVAAIVKMPVLEAIEIPVTRGATV
jgi:hypothetical protein